MTDLDKFQIEEITYKAEGCNDINELMELLKQARSLMKAYESSGKCCALVGYIYHLLDDNNTSYKYYCKADLYSNDEVFKLWVFITSMLSGNKLRDQYIDTAFSGNTKLHRLAQGEYYLKTGNYKNALPAANELFKKDLTDYSTLLFCIKCFNASATRTDDILKAFEQNRLLETSDEGALIYIKTLFRSGNEYECKKQCRKIIFQDSNSPAAQAARNILEDYKKTEEQSCDENNKQINKNINAETIKHGSKNLEDAISKLNSMIGLTSVKEQILRIVKITEYEKIRRKKLNILDGDRSSYHFVFSGNPGTGKTTVARLLADIFYYLGYLEKGQLNETDRSGLVGQFIGETAQKTKRIIEQSLGGVLFIDEAYALFKGGDSKDFGLEAIEVLIKLLEDNRNNFIVILAGYTDEMNKLMKSNPGLKSRFNKFINFPDYTEDELLSIAKQIAFNNHYFFTSDAEQAFLEKICREKIDDKFGNARSVKNIMNNAFEEKAAISLTHTLTEEELTSLFPRDFGVDVNQRPEEKAKYLLNDLDELVGLSNVKKEIKSLIKLIEYEKQETGSEIEVLKQLNLNMIFSGNPGTGKTTAARLYGQILKELNVLKKGQLIEVTRADLVGQYTGHTAKLTRDKCQDAYGGILFIDEAYSLCYGPEDIFGREAVDTLIKEMEDNRDKLIVILAGYTRNMEGLLLKNPGFKSRINKTIYFDDYSQDEMLQIFKLFAEKQNILIDSGCSEMLRQKLSEFSQMNKETFGNGREVRKLFESVKMNMICRVQDENISGEKRRIITADDIK